MRMLGHSPRSVAIWMVVTSLFYTCANSKVSGGIAHLRRLFWTYFQQPFCVVWLISIVGIILIMITCFDVAWKSRDTRFDSPLHQSCWYAFRPRISFHMKLIKTLTNITAGIVHRVNIRNASFPFSINTNNSYNVPTISLFHFSSFIKRRTKIQFQG